MEKKQPPLTTAFVIYIVGVFIGLALVLMSTWSDMESAFYGFTRRASKPLNGLTCPLIMNGTENHTVSLTVKNTTDRRISPSIKSEASTRVAPIETLDSIVLQPGESKTLTWTLGPENRDLRQFIFFKVLVYAAYPIPDRETSCGIYVLDLPVGGDIISGTYIVLALLGMGYGLHLLNMLRTKYPRADQVYRPMLFLALVVIVGFCVSFFGSWVQGIFALVIAATTALASFNFMFLRSRN